VVVEVEEEVIKVAATMNGRTHTGRNVLVASR
jgi:hypothetical protein